MSDRAPALVAAVLVCALVAGSVARATTPPKRGLVVGISGRATGEVPSEDAPRPRRTRPGEQAPPPVESARVLGLLDTVDEGDILGLADGATLWLLERPSTLWRLVGPAQYTLGPRGIKALQGAPSGLAPTHFVLEGLTEDASELGLAWRARELPDDRSLPSGDDGSGAVPRETAVMDARPTLVWRQGRSGERFTAAFWRLDEDGQLAPLERWASLETPRLRPWQALPRGAFVYWRLTGQDGAVGAPDAAWIYVMTTDEVEAVRSDLKALDQARALRPEASEALNVIEAWTRERHGLLEDAAAAYEEMSVGRESGSPTFSEHLQALSRRILYEPRERRGSPAVGGQPAPEPTLP